MSDTRGGYLIIYVMILTFVTMALGLSVLSVVGSQYNYVVDDGYRKNAAHGARACASIVAESLSDDASFSGFSDQVIFDNLNSSEGRVTCSSSLLGGINSAKEFDITTRMYRFINDPSPIAYKMRAVLQSESSVPGANDYLKGGILAGHAGLYAMAWGSLAASQVNVIGKFYGFNSSYSQVGTAAAPIGRITVANVACGDSSNWPQPCTTQPVTQWSGSNFQDIWADTCAPGQTTGITKFKGIGLSTSCTVAATTTPGFDKATFAGKMTNVMEASTLMSTGPEGCIDVVPIIAGYPQYGVRYYGTTVQIPANTRINGDLTTYYNGAAVLPSSNLQNGCTFVFNGDTYVTGSVLADANININMNDTVDENISLVINGKMTLDGHPHFMPNSHGRLLHVISFYSSNPACSGSHVVPSSTQKTCLTNSQAMSSAQVNAQAIPLDPAIRFNGVSSTNWNWSGVTFYAYYGTVHTGCNNITVAAIGGQGVSGGCASVGVYSHLNAVGSDPTFGTLVPEVVPEYKVVDMYRL